MWEQNLFELFTNMIPQAFIFIFLFFTLLNIKIRIKSFLLFSVSFAILTFLIRPYVNFGVHSIIILLFLAFIAILWGKVNTVKSIMSAVITFTIAYLCEISVFFILGMLKFNLEQLNTNPKLRTLIGFLPLLLFFTISIAVYYIKKKLKKEDKIDAPV